MNSAKFEEAPERLTVPTSLSSRTRRRIPYHWTMEEQEFLLRTAIWISGGKRVSTSFIVRRIK